MEDRKKLKSLVEKFKQDLDDNYLDQFAKHLLVECGVIIFREVEETLQRNLEVYTKNDYKIVDDVVFNFDMTRLVKYTTEKLDLEYTIPETVSIIEVGAFSGNCHIEKVTFHNKIYHISSTAFKGCSSLSEIIWGRVSTAGSNVFVECPRLKTIKADNVNVFWNYGCDNLGSPFINGADLYVDGTLCETLTVPAAVEGTLRAFKGCTSIKKVAFSEDNSYVEKILLNIVSETGRTHVC